jgi:hypothetical protein
MVISALCVEWKTSVRRMVCVRLAGRGQPVVLRALVRFAHAPLGFEPPPFFQPVQRRVQGAGFDLELVVRLRADVLSDAVAVLASPLQGPQDEHVEGALEQVEALVV